MLLLELFDGNVPLDPLFEQRAEHIADQMGPRIINACQRDGSCSLESPIEILKQIETAGAKQLQWLANQYVNGGFQLKILPQIQATLAQFQQVKQHLEQKDINQYPDIQTLTNVVQQAAQSGKQSNKKVKKSKRQQFIDLGQAELFYADTQIRVYKINTEAASCEFGKGAKWCTTGDHDNEFDAYARDGTQFIIFTHDKKKFLFFLSNYSHMKSEYDRHNPDDYEEDHVKVHEFKNAANKNVSMPNVINKYPSLITAFNPLASKQGYYWFMKDKSKSRWQPSSELEFQPGDEDAYILEKLAEAPDDQLAEILTKAHDAGISIESPKERQKILDRNIYTALVMHEAESEELISAIQKTDPRDVEDMMEIVFQEISEGNGEDTMILTADLLAAAVKVSNKIPAMLGRAIESAPNDFRQYFNHWSISPKRFASIFKKWKIKFPEIETLTQG